MKSRVSELRRRAAQLLVNADKRLGNTDKTLNRFYSFARSRAGHERKTK
jgi:hypothetical protein